MKEVRIIMNLKKSTKGTHVYGNPDSAIPSVYIKKEAFEGNAPPSIIVTIKENK